MTLLNGDPLDCNNVDELQHWVAFLQDMLENQRGISKHLDEQNGLLLEMNRQQGEKIELLKEGLCLLKERIAQHEAGAVHHHQLRQN